MFPQQIDLVRASWVTLIPRADALSRSFYARLFAIDPDAARLFAHVDMDEQRRKLVQTLAVVVKMLDDPARLLPAVTALGRRHGSYGVEPRHFATVGEALLWALAESLGGAFTPAVEHAWATAYGTLATVMRMAMTPPAIGSTTGAVVGVG